MGGHDSRTMEDSKPLSLDEALLDRRISVTKEDHIELLQQKPVMPANPRLLRVAVLGSPNAGKSTLINQLMGWKVCSVSSKVHTTRKNARAVHANGDTQIVFLDTPGLVTEKHSKRHSLEPSLSKDPMRGANEADVILAVHDISNRPHRYVLDHKLINILARFSHRQHILVLNKIDRLKDKKKLLRVVEKLSGGIINGSKLPVNTTGDKQCQDIEDNYDTIRCWRDSLGKGNHIPDEAVREFIKRVGSWPGFSNVFMVSAMSGDGVHDLENFLLNQSVPGRWLFHPSLVTDQRPDEIALLAVREKFLHDLPQEVPYKLQLQLEYWQVDESGCLDIIIKVLFSQKNLGGIVVGPRGKKIQMLAKEAEQELRNTFRCDVRLKLGVHYQSNIKTDQPVRLGNW